MILDPRDLDRQIDIERKMPDTAADSAGSEQWVPVATKVWAQVLDVLPSRGERLAEGINVTTRPARVRMYWREDITPDMRFVMDARKMAIVSGPAELGYREGLQFMVEDYSSAGNG